MPPVIRRTYLIFISDEIVIETLVVWYPILPDNIDVDIVGVASLGIFIIPFIVDSVFTEPSEIVPPAACAVAIEISPTPNADPITILPLTTFEPIDKAIVFVAVSVMTSSVDVLTFPADCISPVPVVVILEDVVIVPDPDILVAIVAPVSVKAPFIVVFVFTAPIAISVKFVVAVFVPILMVGPTVPDVIVLFPVPILIFPSPVPSDFVLLPTPIFNIPLDCKEHIPKFAVFARGLIVGADISPGVVNSGIALEGVV